MHVKLNLHERIMLFEMVKGHKEFQQGNASNWRMIEAAKKVLGLSEEENKSYGVEIRDSGVEGTAMLFVANKEAAEELKEYILPDSLYAQIIALLTGMNERKELKADSFKLYDRLIGDAV